MKLARLSAWLSGAAIVVFSVAGALSEEAVNPAALGKALGNANTTLQEGMTASEHEGKAIAAKFELEGGKLQLSVYTVKAGKYSEVAVEVVTGAIASVEAIAAGDDFKAAKAQNASLAGVKTSLREAVDKAEAQSPGFRAVSVTPSLKEKHAMATVKLLKGSQLKAVVVPLG